MSMKLARLALVVMLVVGLLTAALAAEAQQAARTPRIAILGVRAMDPSLVEAFKQGLGEFGYREGRNVVVEFAEAGGLMAYGPSLREAFRRAGAYVSRILQGAKPGELPVERPTTFVPVINLRTAKALGLTISQSVLPRADHVIE
jgi:putative ABC transport system substrate-binding protein